MKHTLRVKAYLRYGDDFIVLENDLEKLELLKSKTVDFLNNELKLQVNLKSDKILKPRQGLKYLGVKLWPSGRTLTGRNLARVRERLNTCNISSYSGLMKKHGNQKQIKRFIWQVYGKIIGGDLK
jgi:hypothetical protein